MKCFDISGNRIYDVVELWENTSSVVNRFFDTPKDQMYIECPQKNIKKKKNQTLHIRN